jgi:hypothetical protein
MGGALAWLERNIDERMMRVTELPAATFNALRDDPRFQELAARAGLKGWCSAAL